MGSRILNTFLLKCHAYDDQRRVFIGAINEVFRPHSFQTLQDQTLLHFYGVISVSKFSFPNRNAKMQSRMQNVNQWIQKCYFMKWEFHRWMQNPYPEFGIAVDNANRSCGSLIHQAKLGRQKVKTRIRNANVLWPLKFWRELLKNFDYNAYTFLLRGGARNFPIRKGLTSRTRGLSYGW